MLIVFLYQSFTPLSRIDEDLYGADLIAAP